MRRAVFRTSIAACIAGVLAVSQAALPDEPRRAFESESVRIDPEFAKLGAVGFKTLLSDWYWLQAVQYIGTNHRPVGLGERVGNLIDVVTTLDPWVDHPYRFAAVWMIDDAQSVRKANRLLERGIEHRPEGWRNRYYKAFNHFFYLGENAEAAETLEPVIGAEGAPLYLAPLVARLRSSAAGDLDVASAFLREMIESTPDEDLRLKYEFSLLEIDAERAARFLDDAREEFKKRHGRDIERVEELVEVEPKVLLKLPPEPHGEGWQLDDQGRIVSSYYRFRYEVKIDGTNRALIDKFWERTREKDTTEGEHDDA